MLICAACGAENPEGSRFCNACGERLAEIAPAAEVRKTVTVVFCDVSGSTALGERLDPEALRRVMTRYFEAMTGAIERHGGTVEKFIGDAVMAVFGIPTTHEDDAVRAVRAASDMREALGLLNKELERDHGATLACRIGVHTGEVVAGDVTTRQALVTGDTVNVAARLEQAAAPGDVLISDRTFRLVRDAVVADPSEPLDLKGKSAPVSALRLVEVHAGVAGVARRLDSPIVGRERQLAQVTQAFEQAVADHACHLFTVLGPPGVGKSRLTQEALDRLSGDATVVRGRCLSYGDGITYWPILDVVRDALGRGRDEVADDPSGAIARIVREDPAAEQVAARIEGLLAGDLSVPAEEVAWAVRRFLEALARRAPLIVVFDDLQWGEPGFLDLVDQIADWSRDAPILLLCIARPELLEIRPGWGGGKLRATTAALEPLNEGHATELLANLLGADVIDEPTRRHILTAAEGNPLYVEEIVGMLVDEGRLRREGDGWVAVGELSDVAVPPTIHALLAARLDRLEEGDRAVLGRASVVGEVFYLGAVQDLSPEADREDASRRVRQLVRRDLIRPDVSDIPVQEAFRFHHVLLRDAAYAMLPKESRAELHERFADWLDGQGVPGETDEFVGYHLEQAYGFRRELGPEDQRAAALALRAADRLSIAGSRAADRGDVHAEERLLGRAAALRRVDDPRRPWDLIRLGWTLFSSDRLPESEPILADALRSARASGDERAELQAEVLRSLAIWSATGEGGSARMAETLERVEPRLRKLGEAGELATAAWGRAAIAWNACRYAEARALFDECLRHAISVGDLQLELLFLRDRSAAGVLGSLPVSECLADLDDLAERASRLPSLETQVKVGKAVCMAMLGRFDEARSLIAEGLAAEQEFFGEGRNGYQAAWTIETLADEPERAEPWARANYELMRSKGDVAHGSTAAVFLGQSCLELGRREEAHGLAEECRRTSAADDVVNQHAWRRIEAILAAQRGEAEDARALMRVATEWTERSDDAMSVADVNIDLAEVERLLGDPGAARLALERAAAAYAAKGATVGGARIARRLARLDAG